MLIGRQLALALSFAAVASGCISSVSVEKKHSVVIAATPDDATIWQEDASGKRALGTTPVTVEESYKETTISFNHAWWFSPVVGGIATAVGLGLLAMPRSVDSDGVPSSPGVGPILLVTLGGGEFLASLIYCIMGTIWDGKAVPALPTKVSFTAERPGYYDQISIVEVPSTVHRLDLQLRAKPENAVAIAATSPTRKRDIVAVFDVQDPEGKIAPRTLDQLTDYFTTRLTATASFEVVPREQIRKRLLDEKVRGYKACYDESCQIELGKAVAAQKTVVTKVLRIGNTCALTAVLYDLRKEAAEKASSANTDCTDDGLLASIATIAKELGR